MYATRDDLLEILRDVILTEPPGAAVTGQRLAAGLTALARQFPQDLEVRALAEDAVEVVSLPEGNDRNSDEKKAGKRLAVCPQRVNSIVD